MFRPGGEVEYVDAKDFWSTKVVSNTEITGQLKKSKTETLEYLINRHNPTILQMDIEGLEYEVLCGTKEFGKIRYIILEIHDIVQFRDRKNQLINHLYNHGYDINFKFSRANVLLFTK